MSSHLLIYLFLKFLYLVRLFPGMNTVLSTGPGVWELRDRGLKGRSKKDKSISVMKAIPSVSHMAIVELYESGVLKMLVSQNTDGLHLRSGMNPKGLCELHGNTNLEVCVKCGARYLRDFRTRNACKVHDHFTGRLCDEAICKGRLKDSIINFGEDLPEEDLSKAYLHAEKADLCIVLGSSLRVSPANEIPRNVARKKGKLIICNLQKTPLDCKASLLIHGFCDDVMNGLMQRLDLPIPKWELSRKARMTLNFNKRKNGNKILKVSILGLHPNSENPYSIFERVFFDVCVAGDTRTEEIEKEPFHMAMIMDRKQERLNSVKVRCKLIFHGHYGEPPIDLEEKFEEIATGSRVGKEYLFHYDPTERKWRFSQVDI